MIVTTFAPEQKKFLVSESWYAGAQSEADGLEYRQRVLHWLRTP